MECVWAVAKEAQYLCPWCNKQHCGYHASPNTGGKVGGHSGCNGEKCSTTAVGTCEGNVRKQKCTGCGHYYCDRHWAPCSSVRATGGGHICKTTSGGGAAYALGDGIAKVNNVAQSAVDGAAMLATKAAQSVVTAVGGENKVSFKNASDKPVVVCTYGISDILAMNPYDGFKTVQPGGSLELAGPVDAAGQQRLTVAVLFCKDGSKYWMGMYNAKHGGHVTCKLDYMMNVYPPLQWTGGFDVSSSSSNVTFADLDVVNVVNTISKVVSTPLGIIKELLDKLGAGEVTSGEPSLESKIAASPIRPTGKKKKSKKATPKAEQDDKVTGEEEFESYFSEECKARQQQGDADAAVHVEAHNLREALEPVRFLLLDFRHSLNDVQELCMAPHELAGSAQDLVTTCQVTKLVVGKIKGGGALVDVVKKTLEKCVGAVEKVSVKSKDKLEAMHTKWGLQAKADKVQAYNEKLTKHAPFEKLQKTNGKLALFEQGTQVFADNWPTVKPSLPAQVVEEVEQCMMDSAACLRSSTELISPVTGHAKKLSQVLSATGKVLYAKRVIQMLLTPVTTFFNWLKKQLSWLFEKVIDTIMNLPIVKQIMGWVESFFTWLWDTIMEATGLGKLLDTIAEKMNPFAALQEMGLGMLEHFGLENIDANAILRDAGAPVEVCKLSDIAGEGYTGPNLVFLRKIGTRKTNLQAARQLDHQLNSPAA